MSRPGSYKLLVFDWDGTLMDSESKIVGCVHSVTDELGLPRIQTDEIRNIIGLGLKEAVGALFSEHGRDVHQRVVERYRHYFLRGEDPLSALFPGVRETLRTLRENGYLLAVATGKSRRGLARELDVTGLQDMFDASRCADETFSKPHPRMLEEIMDQLLVGAGETLMIGDTEYDLQMASNAGTHAVAVTYGVHERQRLLQFDPRFCLDSIAELLDRLSEAP